MEKYPPVSPLGRVLQILHFGTKVPEKGGWIFSFPDLKACPPQAGKGYFLKIQWFAKF